MLKIDQNDIPKYIFLNENTFLKLYNFNYTLIEKPEISLRLFLFVNIPIQFLEKFINKNF